MFLKQVIFVGDRDRETEWHIEIPLVRSLALYMLLAQEVKVHLQTEISQNEDKTNEPMN